MPLAVQAWMMVICVIAIVLLLIHERGPLATRANAMQR